MAGKVRGLRDGAKRKKGSWTWTTVCDCWERGIRGLKGNVKNTIKIKFLKISGLNASLQTKGSLVQFPVMAHAWVVGQVFSRGHARGNHTLMFLSFSFSLPSPLSKNK